MITEQMRVLGESWGVDHAKAYFLAIEGDDPRGLKRLMAPDVSLSHANYPPVHGCEEVVGIILGYLPIVQRVEFEIRTLLCCRNLVAVEHVTISDTCQGRRVRIPQVTILENRTDVPLIASLRLYADIADIFRKMEATGS